MGRLMPIDTSTHAGQLPQSSCSMKASQAASTHRMRAGSAGVNQGRPLMTLGHANLQQPRQQIKVFHHTSATSMTAEHLYCAFYTPATVVCFSLSLMLLVCCMDIASHLHQVSRVHCYDSIECGNTNTCAAGHCVQPKLNSPKLNSHFVQKRNISVMVSFSIGSQNSLYLTAGMGHAAPFC